MKKALVLGYGRSGKAAEAVLKAQGYEVAVADGYDLVVASPGLRVESELQLGVERLRRLGVKLLAVTGSKGKSSVVKIVAEALNLAGRKAVPCGNYGLPVCDVPEDCEWAVVEVSSFQLETTTLPPDAFVAAAILNLQEDHLDRHGSAAVYHGLKRKLLGMAAFAYDCEASATADALMAGSYFDNDILRPNGRIAVALMRAAGLDDGQRNVEVQQVPVPDGAMVAGIRPNQAAPDFVRQLVVHIAARTGEQGVIRLVPAFSVK